jgi:hypothetical protein
MATEVTKSVIPPRRQERKEKFFFFELGALCAFGSARRSLADLIF